MFEERLLYISGPLDCIFSDEGEGIEQSQSTTTAANEDSDDAVTHDSSDL